jgi:hypothetical protein
MEERKRGIDRLQEQIERGRKEEGRHPQARKPGRRGAEVLTAFKGASTT